MNEFRLRKKELELQNQRMALGHAYEELEKIITKSKGSSTSLKNINFPLSGSVLNQRQNSSAQFAANEILSPHQIPVQVMTTDSQNLMMHQNSYH